MIEDMREREKRKRKRERRERKVKMRARGAPAAGVEKLLAENLTPGYRAPAPRHEPVYIDNIIGI